MAVNEKSYDKDQGQGLALTTWVTSRLMELSTRNVVKAFMLIKHFLHAQN
jgi:hypothetical protein